VKEKGNQTKPALRPHSTNTPEDSKKNKTKQKPIVEEEFQTKSLRERQNLPLPRQETERQQK
jgi:hypothetical protein